MNIRDGFGDEPQSDLCSRRIIESIGYGFLRGGPGLAWSNAMDDPTLDGYGLSDFFPAAKPAEVDPTLMVGDLSDLFTGCDPDETLAFDPVDDVPAFLPRQEPEEGAAVE